MAIFQPDYRFRRAWDIPPEWLRDKGITVLLLDVDNTLTTHDNPDVADGVHVWLAKLRAANNRPARVEPFAEKLGVGCIADAAKPLGGGVRRARERLGADAREIAIVGDQVFTDVLCANLAGAASILVEPIELEDFPFFKLKRRLERLVLRGGRKGTH